MLGRHIRTAGLRLVEAALTKHALALVTDQSTRAPNPGVPHEPTSTSPTAAAAVPKVVSTPPAT